MRLRAVAVVALLIAAGCASPNRSPSPANSRLVRIVAAENVWGSIAAQVGGSHAATISIISNPATDPHAYEPTPADGRTLASADLVIVNGVGYDGWATKLLAADGQAKSVINVGTLTHVPAGGNPHRWYNPTDVETVVRQLVGELSKLDPADAGYFQAQRMQFETVDLGAYHELVASIKARYAGTPVGASESIFSMLAPALDLNVLTPDAFLKAITEGTDVSAADKTTIDNQVKGHLIKIYVYNSQNATPDVAAQVKQCQALRIPTPAITETLVPATATYQEWQVAQLKGIEAALAQATGR